MEKFSRFQPKQRSPRHRRWLFFHPDAWNFRGSAVRETNHDGSITAITGHCKASFLWWFKSGKKIPHHHLHQFWMILMDVSGRICEFYHVLPVFHSILLIPRPVSLVKQRGGLSVPRSLGRAWRQESVFKRIHLDWKIQCVLSNLYLPWFWSQPDQNLNFPWQFVFGSELFWHAGGAGV